MKISYVCGGQVVQGLGVSGCGLVSYKLPCCGEVVCGSGCVVLWLMGNELCLQWDEGERRSVCMYVCV